MSANTTCLQLSSVEYSIWPGQGFYVAPFLIDAIPSEQQSKKKMVFFDSVKKTHILLCFRVILGCIIKYSLIGKIFNYINFIPILLGKAELSMASCTK